jgi:hypothetical protein
MQVTQGTPGSTDEYFTKEYEVKLQQWVRRRFRDFSVVPLILVLLVLSQSILMVIAITTPLFVTEMIEGALPLGVILWFLLVIRPTLDSPPRLIRSATHLVKHAAPDAAWPSQLQIFTSNYARGNFIDDVLVVALDYRARMQDEEPTDDVRS